MSSIDPNTYDPNQYQDDPYWLDNGGFEDGCSAMTVYDFMPPVYWERIVHPSSDSQEDCYAGLHSSFSLSRWEITSAYEGETFVLLSTGGFDGATRDIESIGDSSIYGSMISQKVELSAGDTILGAYFFATSDWLKYNDYGQISFKLAADPNDYPDSAVSFVIPQSYCDVETVGNYQTTLSLAPETNGWIDFAYTVEPNQVGPYNIRCEVSDFGDDLVNSYYAVDNLRICKGGLSQADVNQDCTVNMEDFAYLSEAWLSFCPDPRIDDPNFPGDPNDFPNPADPNLLDICEALDHDKSWYVDTNDLIFMGQEWMR